MTAVPEPDSTEKLDEELFRHCIPPRDEEGQIITAQRFQLLVETARERIWTLDTQNNTPYVNRRVPE